MNERVATIGQCAGEIVGNAAGSATSNPTQADAPSQTNTRQEQLAIGGMRCAACAQLIEFRLQQLDGVESIRIDLIQQRATVRWQAARTSLRQIIDVVSRLGYSALPIARAAEEDARQAKQALWRLFVAGFAMMQIMMLAFPAYLQPVPQIDGDLTPDIDQLLKIASLLLSVPVMIFSARPFLQRAWLDLANRHIGMEVPVALGMLFTFVASVWATFTGGPVYYDSFVMFVFLLLGVRWLEARVQAQSTAALRELTTLVPLQVERYRAWDGLDAADQAIDQKIDQTIETVEAQQLQVGDVLRVRPGAQIAVDGEVLQGSSEVDEAMMTGEARAVRKDVGAQVLAGSINLSAVLVMRATRVGSQTEFAGLLNLMQSAAQHKPRLVQMADRYASRILGAILLLALLSFGLWYRLDASRAWQIAISVMVVTCPCALSLATPGVMAAVLGRLAKRGVLVLRGHAIESLDQASHFVFDKTGTLTSGQLQVVQTVFYRDGAGAQQEALRCTAALAGASLHPLAQALAQSLSGQAAVNLQQIEEVPGLGMQAQYQGQSWRLGAPHWVQALSDGAGAGGLAGQDAAKPQGQDAPMRQEQGVPVLEGHEEPVLAEGSQVAIGNSAGVWARFVLQDQLRPDALALITSLQAQGKTVCMLSGDQPAVVAQVAAQLGMVDARGGLSPQQKYCAVQAMQQQGARVAMVGDGMNDGPVLALADVAIAMGQGAPISQTRSDLVLLGNRLQDLQQAQGLSQFACGLIRQNLGWALLYNVLAIPAAMAGMLNPWQAALGMSISSLLVVANALRALRWQEKSSGNHNLVEKI